MENNKNITTKKSINEITIDDVYAKFIGEYQPDEFTPKKERQPERKSQESDMGEGKLLTKFLTGK
jgi:hypothetical protein